MDTPIASVVIPAHNEQGVIEDLLEGLLGRPDEVSNRNHEPVLEVVVVANGCSDETEGMVRDFADRVGHSPSLRVVLASTPEASKRRALMLGDSLARYYPRVWLDADVVLGAGDIALMCDALRHHGALACGPEREIALEGCPTVVRWFYDVWLRLPAVQTGLFGRGAIVMSEEGHRRAAAIPDVMGDDLAVSEAFSPAERVIERRARVLIHPPRRVDDLIRRRSRAMTSSTQLEVLAGPDGDPRPVSSRTGAKDLVRMVKSRPALAPKVVVFVAVAMVARARSARAVGKGDFTTWLRDESSRQR